MAKRTFMPPPHASHREASANLLVVVLLYLLISLFPVYLCLWSLLFMVGFMLLTVMCGGWRACLCFCVLIPSLVNASRLYKGFSVLLQPAPYGP